MFIYYRLRFPFQMSHFYLDPVSKSYFPSVTTILQTVLPEPDSIKMWKSKNKNWKTLLKESSDTGTLVHFSILNPLADYTLDPSDLLPLDKWYKDTAQKLELATMMFDELLKKKKMTLLQPRRIESKILNREEKYAGKFDLFCPVKCQEYGLDGHRVLFDIKTSANIYETHKIQLGGYYASFPEDEKPDRVALIKITPDARRNPRLEADLHIYSRSLAEKWADQFIELARRFHSENMKPTDDIIPVD